MPAGRAEQWATGASRRLGEATRTYLADGGARLPAWALLAVLCAASATLLVVLGTRLSFFNDDWHFVLQRTGFTADTIFESYNGHLSAMPVLAYKGLIGLFGLDSQVPFRLAIAAVVIALAVAVFLFVRERAGNLLALDGGGAAAVPRPRLGGPALLLLDQPDGDAGRRRLRAVAAGARHAAPQRCRLRAARGLRC